MSKELKSPLRANSDLNSATPPVHRSVVSLESSRTSAEGAMLRIEFDRVAAELENKRRTISKLEHEVLHYMKQAELERSRTDEKIAAVQRDTRKEIEAQERTSSSFMSQIQEQRSAREQAETQLREALQKVDTLTLVERRLKELQLLLEERQSRVDELRSEKKELEAKFQAAQSADRSKVLEGRIMSLQEIIDQRDKRIQKCEDQNADLQRALEEVEKHAAQVSEQYQQAEHQSGEKSVQIETMKLHLASSKAREEKLQQTIREEKQKHQDSNAAWHVKCVGLEALLSELREDLREKHKYVDELQLQLSQRESDVTVVSRQAEDRVQEIHRVQERLHAAEERIRRLQSTVEEAEAQAAREKILAENAQSDGAQQKALVATLRQELDAMRAELTSMQRGKDNALVELSRKEAIEEKLLVLQSILQRQDSDLTLSNTSLTDLRNRLTDAQCAMQKHDVICQTLQDAEHQCRVKSAALEVLFQEKQSLITALHETNDKMQEARGKLQIVESKLGAEGERRKDLERKILALENSAVGSYTIEGRYAALQAFLEGASSESAKSAQLAATLLEEVKHMERRLQETEAILSVAQEEKRSAQQKLLELEVKQPALHEAKKRLDSMQSDVKQSREVNAELRRTVDELDNRVRDVTHHLQLREAEISRLRAQLMSASTALSRVEQHERSREGSWAAEHSPPGSSPKTRPQHQSKEAIEAVSAASPKASAGIPAQADGVDASADRMRFLRELQAANAETRVYGERVAQLEAVLVEKEAQFVAQDTRVEALSADLREAMKQVMELRTHRQAPPVESPSKPTESSETPRARAQTPNSKAASRSKQPPKSPKMEGRTASSGADRVQSRSPRVAAVHFSSSPKQLVNAAAAHHIGISALRRENTDLTLQLSDAKRRIAQILTSETSRYSPRQLVAPVVVGDTAVISPPRPQPSN